MSSLLRGKTKLSQNDLRRFMTEQKKKLQQNDKKIDSPLAKYRSDGQLTCIVCNTIVRSEKVWTVHINGKQHKDNLVQIKQGIINPSAQIPNTSTKRCFVDEPTKSPKKLKGILKNAPKPSLPEGFFDSENRKQPDQIKKSIEPNKSESLIANNEGEEEGENEEDSNEKDKNSDLPEGFFDDPVMDAKARNVEYKDPIQEEWERFQKEIKEENTVSAQIIEDDHEEAIAERQIDEIDEQLRNWSRVLDLEVKKEKVQTETVKANESMDQDHSSDDDDDFDEFLDWRAKRSFR